MMSTRRRTKDESVRISKTDGIAPGRARMVEISWRQIALFNVNGRFYAIDNVCTHRSALLAERDR
jgi:nitrite reductase/ring-hydroxylating ferredoxin subunit